jgi:MoxR-like ATPase
MDTDGIQALHERLQAQVHRVVVGQEAALELLLLALLAEGHVLLEGVPGTAKTLLAQTFSAVLTLDFKRIQFTPDLMPGDVLGTNLFNFQTNQFVLTKGPIFTQILLADEINRTPPKTQAALLQAMQERVVTIDGTDHPLGPAFMVVATQNPIEQEGTYPLPEAQLDRFLFKVQIGYPSRDQEREMVRLHGHHTAMPRLEEFDLRSVTTLEELAEARAVVRAVRLSDELVDYVVDIVRATRTHRSLACGASPRAANMLATAARASAAIAGRPYVLPDDVKGLLVPALRHRVLLSPAAEIEGVTAEKVLAEVMERVPVPR